MYNSITRDNNVIAESNSQAILAPLVDIIDQFKRVQRLGEVGSFEVIAVRRVPEEFGCDDAEFLRDAIEFCGGEELQMCESSGPDGRSFQVAGSSHGLATKLRKAPADGVDTGLRVVWICPRTSNSYPISNLRHLMDVVSTFARRSGGKVTA